MPSSILKFPNSQIFLEVLQQFNHLLPLQDQVTEAVVADSFF